VTSRFFSRENGVDILPVWHGVATHERVIFLRITNILGISKRYAIYVSQAETLKYHTVGRKTGGG